MIRFGIGYDVHKLAASRKLILGGVEIPHKLGLEAHSDGDVLIHAIIDALLGAANLKTFPALNFWKRFLHLSRRRAIQSAMLIQ